MAFIIFLFACILGLLKTNKITIIIALLSGALLLYSLSLFASSTKIYVTQASMPIYSLDRDLEAEGEFVLGTESMGGKIIYIVLQEEDNGFYEVPYSSNKYGKVYIIKTDESEPRIEVKKLASGSDFANLMVGGIVGNDLFIYIPEDSITRDYDD